MRLSYYEVRITIIRSNDDDANDGDGGADDLYGVLGTLGNSSNTGHWNTTTLEYTTSTSIQHALHNHRLRTCTEYLYM